MNQPTWTPLPPMRQCRLLIRGPLVVCPLRINETDAPVIPANPEPTEQ